MFSYVSSLFFLRCAISLLQKHTGAKQLTLEDPQMTMSHPYTMPTPYTSLPAQVPWRCRALEGKAGENTQKKHHKLVSVISQIAKQNPWALNECFTFHSELSGLVGRRGGLHVSAYWCRLPLPILKPSGKQTYCGS